MRGKETAPNHWSFGQLSSLVGAPAAYLRQLPAPLAGINLQYGLTNHRIEQIKTMQVADGRTELRAVTGPDYGRIYDYELVSAVQRIAGNCTGDMRWNVPGVPDWSTGIYNPRVDVTKETTTLTKARILETVREAKGEDDSDRIAGLKKAEMVMAAKDLLSDTGWMPKPLRTPPLPERPRWCRDH